MAAAAISGVDSYSVKVLADGYSRLEGGMMLANCTCTLVRGPGLAMIVDTMTAWDRDRILRALAAENTKPSEITHCVATHGHYDHIGNMNLFQEAQWHVVGFTVFQPPDKCYLHPFESGEPLVLDGNVRIVPTPGHTLSDVSVVVENVAGMGTVAIVGDLFEREEDVEDPKLWQEAGSEAPDDQRKNRHAVAKLADWIVPGHGAMFEVTDGHRAALAAQMRTDVPPRRPAAAADADDS